MLETTYSLKIKAIKESLKESIDKAKYNKPEIKIEDIDNSVIDFNKIKLV